MLETVKGDVNFCTDNHNAILMLLTQLSRKLKCMILLRNLKVIKD